MSDPAVCPEPHRARGLAKLAAVGAILGIVLFLLIRFVDQESLNDLRHHLTLWLIIAIVVIINIISFLLFALFWTVYRWIKRDLDPQVEE